MKHLLVLVLSLSIFYSINLLAREPKATICGDKAVEAARGVALVNEPVLTPGSEIEISLKRLRGDMEKWLVEFSTSDVSKASKYLVVAKYFDSEDNKTTCVITSVVKVKK